MPEGSIRDMLHRELVSIRPLIERELIQFSLSRVGELSSSPNSPTSPHLPGSAGIGNDENTCEDGEREDARAVGAHDPLYVPCNRDTRRV